MALDCLFAEGKIGHLALKNRVVLPAMGSMFPEKDGSVSDRLIAYHVARVKGGCGMNIVEVAAVHPTTKGPRTLAIYDDTFIPGLSRLAGAIREAGGRAAIQIWHAGRQTYSKVTGEPLMAPSAIPCPVCRDMPVEMSVEDIERMIEAYGDAALRARKAGFDAVEIHGAHGYLIAQFMSAYSNKRMDEYGGPLANRARFALAVVKNVREKVGGEFPVLYRLSAEEHVPGGLTMGDTKIIVKMLEDAGVDALHISAGVYESLPRIIPPLDFPTALNSGNAAAVKRIVKIPVIAAIRINDPEMADRIIREEKADFVAIGRGQLADPEFCNKAQAGDYDAILRCIGCNQGCVDRLFLQGKSISCLRNPATGREVEYALHAAGQVKKILVVGGGPAGLEAATVMKRRGHEVILVEKAERPGGQFVLAGVAPRKKEMAEAALQMGRIAERLGVDIRLRTELTPELLDDIRPDEIIVATGSLPLLPEMKGREGRHVLMAHDVLSGLKDTGQSVVVIGGGLIGMEVAELLTSRGKKVIIVEMLDKIANGLGVTRKRLAMSFIKENGIQVLLRAKCVEVRENAVVVEQDGVLREIGNVDSVVVAVGVKSARTVETILKEKGYSYKMIGDAREVGKALEAIWDGAAAGRAV